MCIFGGHSIGDSDGRGSRAVLKNEATVPFDCTTPLPTILSGTPPPTVYQVKSTEGVKNPYCLEVYGFLICVGRVCGSGCAPFLRCLRAFSECFLIYSFVRHLLSYTCVPDTVLSVGAAVVMKRARVWVSVELLF